MFQRILTNTINASMHLLTNPAALGQTRPLGPINLVWPSELSRPKVLAV